MDNLVMDINKEIGIRLKTARNEAGMTLKDVVTKISGLTISTLGGYESGRRAISIEIAKKLAAALNKDASYLLTLTNEIEPMHRIAVRKDIIFDQLVEIYARMTNSQRYELVLQADDLLNNALNTVNEDKEKLNTKIK
jgi:transcriptional regulator with XRE-family HTH domain